MGKTDKVFSLSNTEDNTPENKRSAALTLEPHKLFNFKHFLLISLSILLLMLTYYFYQLWDYSSEHKSSAEFFERSITSSLSQYDYLPELLAKDNLVIDLLKKPGIDHKTVSDKLEFTAKKSKASDIFLLNMNGKAVATSNYQQEQNFLHKNYSFRPYFQNAIQENKRQSYFAKGITTGIPGFFISAPVNRDNQTIGVIVVKLYLSEWENNWNNANDSIIVADANKVIVLSSEDKWRYLTVGKLTEDNLLELYISKQFPKETHITIYSDKFSYSVGNKKINYWSINNEIYVVHDIKIGDTNWTFYHLAKHEKFIYRLFVFFALVTLLGVTLYFFLHERSYRLDLKQRTRDIEKRRLHERQTLIDNIHIGIIVFQKNGHLLSMNEQAKKLLLSKKDKADINYQDTHINELINIELTTENIKNFIHDNITIDNQYNETTTKINHLHEDGDKKTPLIFSIADFTYADKKAYLMTIINITRLKKAENELILLNESLEEKVNHRTQELKTIQNELIQQNKTVALGNMAGTIVHELSQPLSAINSSVGALLNKMDKQNWTGAKESAKRLLPLSNKMRDVINLLKFFSYPDDNNEIIELNQIVYQSTEVLKDILKEKNITLNNKPNEASIYIQSNSIKLDLALSNLLKNAIDALENGHQPTISIDSELNSDTETPIVSLHIQDNGTGVDEHIMGQLFNPYFTTKEVGKGMGLGLAITYEIIKQYGGDITAKNTKNGAKFTIQLPVHTVITETKALV